MEENDRRIVCNMLDKLNRIYEICSKYSFDEITSNYLLSDSLQFEYQKLYFDASKLSVSFIQENQTFPIEKIRGIRNRVAHDYEAVSIKILFDTGLNDVPQIKQILADLI